MTTEEILLEICDKISLKAEELYRLNGTDSYMERCALSDAKQIVYFYTDKYKEEQKKREDFKEAVKKSK